MLTALYLWVAYEIYAFHDEPVCAWIWLGLIGYVEWVIYIKRVVLWII